MSSKALIGLLISLILIVALIFLVDWPKVWIALQQMKLWPLIPAIILFNLQNLIRSLRWRLLLADGKQVGTRALFDSLMVGNLGNYLLPLRAGEFTRPLLLTRYCSISFPACLVSVIVERFFDLAMVLALFGGVTFFLEGIPNQVYYGAGALSTMAVAILTVMVLGSFMEEKLLRLVAVLLQPFPEKIGAPLKRFSKDFLDGAAVLRTPSRVFQVISYTFVVWSLVVALYWVFFLMFDITPTLEVAVATTVITALMVAAPSAPGFVGVYQVACVAAFALFSFPTEKAVAFSIITHIFHFIGFILLGGYVLWRDGLRLGDLKTSAVK